jgi:cephalosporin hydroxylase
MSLTEIVDNSKTDKNTTHAYLPLYQQLLANKKETATNILEIGVKHGGSIKLWHDFFTNATIYGLNIIPIKDIWTKIKNKYIIFMSIVKVVKYNILYKVLYYEFFA